jgi:hypothetical protein
VPRGSRVVIDNEASSDATVIRVDSVNSHGTLLAVVQVIADLNLVIRKAYFSSDGNWFMDGQHSIRFPVSIDSDLSPQKSPLIVLSDFSVQCYRPRRQQGC